MKATVVWFTFFFLCFKSAAHAQCISNPDFAEYCDSVVVNNSGCETFNQNCAGGWIRSHGTPEIEVPNANNPLDNYAYMWAAVKTLGFEGEGIFNSYNFVENQSYTIRIRANMVTQGNAGSFRIYLTNALVQGSSSWCGFAVPSIPNDQLQFIAENFSRNQGWQTYEYTFTANKNFTQIWVYPYTTSTSQLNLSVDFIRLCPTSCLGTKFYTQGVLPPGATQYGNIYIGSSYGGSGTVTVSGTSQTSMIAANEVRIKHDFWATVSSGSFIVKIQQCADPETINYPDDLRPNYNITEGPDSIDNGITIKDEGEYSSESPNQVSSVYPNPTAGKLAVEFFAKSNKVKVKLLTSTGAILSTYEKQFVQSGRQRFEVDVSKFTPGTYFLQIIDGDQLISRQFVKL